MEALRATAWPFAIMLGAIRGRRKRKLGVPCRWVTERTQEKRQLFSSGEDTARGVQLFPPAQGQEQGLQG